MHAQLLQLCLTPCDLMDCSPPGSSLSVGILQARILECVAMPSPKGTFQPKDRTLILSYVSCIGRWIFYDDLSHTVSFSSQNLSRTPHNVFRPIPSVQAILSPNPPSAITLNILISILQGSLDFTQKKKKIKGFQLPVFTYCMFIWIITE